MSIHCNSRSALCYLFPGHMLTQFTQSKVMTGDSSGLSTYTQFFVVAQVPANGKSIYTCIYGFPHLCMLWVKHCYSPVAVSGNILGQETLCSLITLQSIVFPVLKTTNGLNFSSNIFLKKLAPAACPPDPTFPFSVACGKMRVRPSIVLLKCDIVGLEFISLLRFGYKLFYDICYQGLNLESKIVFFFQTWLLVPIT